MPFETAWRCACMPGVEACSQSCLSHPNSTWVVGTSEAQKGLFLIQKGLCRDLEVRHAQMVCHSVTQLEASPRA